MPSAMMLQARVNNRGPSSSLSAGDIARARSTSSRYNAPIRPYVGDAIAAAIVPRRTDACSIHARSAQYTFVRSKRPAPAVGAHSTERQIGTGQRTLHRRLPWRLPRCRRADDGQVIAGPTSCESRSDASTGETLTPTATAGARKTTGISAATGAGPRSKSDRRAPTDAPAPIARPQRPRTGA